MIRLPRSRTGRAVLGATGALLVAAALPAVASAHGLGGVAGLPIPVYVFAWAAAAVLIVSFVALSRLWSTARLEGAAERLVAQLPRVLDPLCGALGVLIFAGLLYCGFAGAQDDPDSNLLPVVVYIYFWVGTPIASALFGDVFRAFNPWRALGRAASWGARRAGLDAQPLRAYPARLGRWPAAAGILAFAWLELVAPPSMRETPLSLAILAVVYAAVQLAGMRVYGVEPWERRADPFAVYFGLFARISPLRWAAGRVTLRAPLKGLTDLDMPAGTVPLLCVMIGSTSFDGFSRGTIWTQTLPRWESGLSGLKLGPETAGVLINTCGLLVMVLIAAWLFRLGVTGMHTVGDRQAAGYLARRFVHSLVPIALAYVIAHYFSLMAIQGQDIVYLISDPLGTGANLFGTARVEPDLKIVGNTAIWYFQVGALLIGHVSGLVLAHDRALVLYRRVYDATRSQYWMLAVMVCFTCLGLWLLSGAA